MIKDILFDFDGTLINTNDVIIVSFQHTFKYYLGHEVEVSKITKFFGEPLRTTMEREFKGVDPDEAMSVYRKFQLTHAEQYVKTFPGVEDMLKALTNKGYRLSIVTSRTTESTLNYLRQFNLQDYFYNIVSCDDTSIHKPNPEPINCALRKLGITKEEAIMIGDGPFDIKCANNAGVQSVYVGWRITDDFNPVVGEIRPDYEIEKPEDLVDLMESINK